MKSTGNVTVLRSDMVTPAISGLIRKRSRLGQPVHGSISPLRIAKVLLSATTSTI